jgi:hypothetical protein
MIDDLDASQQVKYGNFPALTLVISQGHGFQKAANDN